MPVIFANGKRVMIPAPVTTSQDIVKATTATEEPDMRAVMRVTDTGIERLDPTRVHHVSHGDRFVVGPDRIKGSTDGYFGHKEDWRRRVIADQVRDVAHGLFHDSEVVLDDKCNWVVFSGFELPQRWAAVNPGHRFVKMMLVFPDAYPEVPTNGFYLPEYLNMPWGEMHSLSRGVGGAFGVLHVEAEALRVNGWRWYCAHVTPGTWHPARIRRIGDWRDGDSLWNLIVLALEVLSSGSD